MLQESLRKSQVRHGSKMFDRTARIYMCTGFDTLLDLYGFLKLPIELLV